MENKAFADVEQTDCILTHTNMINFIKCSPIKQILEINEDTLVIETSSGGVYELNKVEEDEK